MTICFRDILGISTLEVDYPAIDFINGEVFFAFGGEEYRIGVDAVISITDTTP